MLSPAFLSQLRRLLPPHSVLYEREDLVPFESDGLSAYRNIPDVVALPENEAQVAAILQLCHQNKVAVVARGAGTGLAAGALPIDGAVLLVLSRLNQIKNIDPLARTATVQPGVRNLAISEAAVKHNLYYAPDPSSQIACSIGGNVAENSGGVHCLKYGLTVHNILKLRAWTIDGQLLEIGSDTLDAAGYDLLALLTGSEGMLAVITEVTVKLLPRPQRAQVVLAAFDDVVKAGAAVGNIIAAGVIPAGLEMMDRLAIQAAEAFVHAGYPLDCEALLLCEVDGVNEEVSDDIFTVREVLTASGATEIRTAESEEQRLKFWAGRKAAFPAVGRLAPSKGFDVLVRAFEAARLPRGRLVIVGEGGERRRLRRLAGERVSLVGFRRDVKDLYQAFDLFVSPSRIEPFGRVIIEALDGGVPVIATDAQGPRDIARRCPIEIVARDDVDALAGALARAAAQPRRRLNVDLSEFCVENIVGRMISAYREVIAAQEAVVLDGRQPAPIT